MGEALRIFGRSDRAARSGAQFVRVYGVVKRRNTMNSCSDLPWGVNFPIPAERLMNLLYANDKLGEYPPGWYMRPPRRSHPAAESAHKDRCQSV
jgi:hypothetical protein